MQASSEICPKHRGRAESKQGEKGAPAHPSFRAAAALSGVRWPQSLKQWSCEEYHTNEWIDGVFHGSHPLGHILIIKIISITDKILKGLNFDKQEQQYSTKTLYGVTSFLDSSTPSLRLRFPVACPWEGLCEHSLKLLQVKGRALRLLRQMWIWTVAVSQGLIFVSQWTRALIPLL